MTRSLTTLVVSLLASCGGATGGAGPDPVEPASQIEPEVGGAGGEAPVLPASEGGSAARGRVTLDPVTCDPPGEIDEAVVDRHFESMLPQFGACYDDVLRRDDGLDGDYTVEVVLISELGTARCGGYTHVKAGFWIAGFQECLGEHLLGSQIGTPVDEPVTCQLVLHFTVE
jgi:hypothetical protein